MTFLYFPVMYYFQQHRQFPRRLAPLLARAFPGILAAAFWAGGCQFLGGDSEADGSARTDSTAADSTAADSTAAADTSRADTARIDAVPVETALSTIGDISSFLLFSSTVETEAAVEIHPEVSGLVEVVAVEEGDHVAAGDTLVKLDADQARLDDRESAMELRHLEMGYKRTEEMFRRGLIAPQDHEDRLFHLDEARLKVEKARLALENTVIRAPFAGVITTRQVQVGARVAPGDKLFDLVKIDDMIARVYVPGRYLTRVEVGQRAVVVSDFLQDMEFEGYVKRISPVVDPKSGTFKVTVGLRDRWEHLRPGVFVNVRVVTDTHTDAVLLPKQAVVYDGGERYVFVVEDSTASRVSLDAGYEDSRFIEALSGIAAGAPVIVIGQAGLKDKARVKVVSEHRADPEPRAASGQG